MQKTDFAYSSISNVKYTSFSFSRIAGNKENIDRRFFYGLMSIILNNDPSILIESALSYGSDVKKNRELLNKEKIELLNKYKYYLSKSDDDTVNMENPIMPEDESKREIAKKIMKDSFYKSSENIERVKNGSRFYFHIKDDVLEATIDQHTRQIKTIVLKTSYGKVSAVMRDYVIMNNNYELPEYIVMTLSNGKKYKVRPTKLAVYNDTNAKFDNRLKKYKGHFEKNSFLTPPKSLEILSL